LLERKFDLKVKVTKIYNIKDDPSFGMLCMKYLYQQLDIAEGKYLEHNEIF